MMVVWMVPRLLPIVTSLWPPSARLYPKLIVELRRFLAFFHSILAVIKVIKKVASSLGFYCCQEGVRGGSETDLSVWRRGSAADEGVMVIMIAHFGFLRLLRIVLS